MATPWYVCDTATRNKLRVNGFAYFVGRGGGSSLAFLFDITTNWCIFIVLLKSRYLCCLRQVYSLPQAVGYVPPVHHSAAILLIKDLWSLCSQEMEHVKVSVLLKTNEQQSLNV